MLGQGDPGIGGQPGSPGEAHNKANPLEAGRKKPGQHQSPGAALYQEFRETQAKDVKLRTVWRTSEALNLGKHWCPQLEGHTTRVTRQLMHALGKHLDKGSAGAGSAPTTRRRSTCTSSMSRHAPRENCSLNFIEPVSPSTKG